MLILDDGAGGNLGLMHIQPDDTLVQRRQFHLSSVCGRVKQWKAAMLELKEPEGDKSPTAFLTFAL